MKKKFKISFILAGILAISFLQTIIFPVIIGAISVGIVSGIFSCILFETLDIKIKNIYLSMIFMVAAEIGVILGVIFIHQLIDMSIKLSLLVILLTPKAHTISYFLYRLAMVANKKRGNQ